ncbi:hypothetical protein RN22_22335 [Grimontia sp. AD028]|uniref:hypothetical protein n=1 Tax=Grimontia sp. AD028 TaxID=1581149 RepID=UPI00061AD8D1|nr:hypothetical protein [Grimontia sp. AD028]KKD58214.1 hypothetical protein RN22_22335 [Grimontia sp. AD028]
MDVVDAWMKKIQNWYEDAEHRNVDTLAAVVSQTPAMIFDPPIDLTRSDAIAYFVDGCTKLQRHHQFEGKAEEAFSYLQFCYAKLQALASRSDIEPDIKRWSLKKLDILIVAMMEFCQQQNDAAWQRESEQLVELHVTFMMGQNDLNLHTPARPY